MTPHRFQSGFVANRIARFERMRLGDDSIRYVSMHRLIQVPGEKRVVKSVAFYIQRDGKNGPEYFVSHSDGFCPMPAEEADVNPS
jgi:hypothetical protein